MKRSKTFKTRIPEAFETARIEKQPYVFVKIDAEGIEEVIVIPEKSFDAKEKFYLNAYDDNLAHVMNKNVKIIQIGYGNKDNLDIYFE